MAEIDDDFYVGITPIQANEFGKLNPITPKNPIRAMRRRPAPVIVPLDFHVSWWEGDRHYCRCFGDDDLAAFRFAQALKIMQDCYDC